MIASAWMLGVLQKNAFWHSWSVSLVPLDDRAVNTEVKVHHLISCPPRRLKSIFFIDVWTRAVQIKYYLSQEVLRAERPFNGKHGALSHTFWQGDDSEWKWKSKRSSITCTLFYHENLLEKIRSSEAHLSTVGYISGKIRIFNISRVMIKPHRGIQVIPNTKRIAY